MSEQIPLIKKEAQIQITVATPFIERVQKLLMFLMLDKSEEQTTKLIEEINNGKTEFSEDWMNHYFTTMMFLHTIDKAAQEQGFVEFISSQQDN